MSVCCRVTVTDAFVRTRKKKRSEGCEIDGGAFVDGGDETDDELRDL